MGKQLKQLRRTLCATACAVTGIALLCGSAGTVFASKNATETIVLLRHGEKPLLGLGQLTCQGLNRSLALPAVLQRLFGTPDAIFAPNSSDTKRDVGGVYSYVRPLATIEPSAVVFGLPIDTRLGYDDVDGLVAALQRDDLKKSLVFVAWEHRKIVEIARKLLTAEGGNAETVPDWDGDDFDSLYVVRLARAEHGGTSASFEHLQEGLNGLPTKCPN